MANLVVSSSVCIEAPAEVVRSQFGDVAHHARAGVHKGVVFEVTEEDPGCCRYRQLTRVGPLTLVQEFELDRHDSGPLVNRIVGGQFAGGSVTFDVLPDGETACEVVATVEGPARGLQRLILAPLRRQVSRSLAAALAEDKADIEGGHYPRSAGSQ